MQKVSESTMIANEGELQQLPQQQLLQQQLQQLTLQHQRLRQKKHNSMKQGDLCILIYQLFGSFVTEKMFGKEISSKKCAELTFCNIFPTLHCIDTFDP